MEAGVDNGAPAWVVEKAARETERSLDSFVAAVRSGLRIAAGTDAGTPFNWHEDLARELELMVKYGLSPMQAIVAATRDAARNLDHRIGTIELDKAADLIVVDGAADQEIRTVGSVEFVMKDGIVHRDRLSAAAAPA